MERFYCLYSINSHPYVWILKKVAFGNVGYFQKRVDAVDFFRDHYLDKNMILWYQNETGFFEGSLKYTKSSSDPRVRVNELSIEKFKTTIKSSLEKKRKNTIKEFYIHPNTMLTIPYKERSKYDKKRTYILENKEKERLQALKVNSRGNLMDVPHFYVGENGLEKHLIYANDVDYDSKTRPFRTKPITLSSETATKPTSSSQNATSENTAMEKPKNEAPQMNSFNSFSSQDSNQLVSETQKKANEEVVSNINRQVEEIKQKRAQLEAENAHKVQELKNKETSDDNEAIKTRLVEIEQESKERLEKKEAEQLAAFKKMQDEYENEAKKYLSDLEDQQLAKEITERETRKLHDQELEILAQRNENLLRLERQEVERLKRNIEVQRTQAFKLQSLQIEQYKQAMLQQRQEWENALRHKSYNLEAQLQQQSAYFNSVLYKQFSEQHNLRNYLAQQQYRFELDKYHAEVERRRLLNEVNLSQTRPFANRVTAQLLSLPGTETLQQQLKGTRIIAIDKAQEQRRAQESLRRHAMLQHRRQLEKQRIEEYQRKAQFARQTNALNARRQQQARLAKERERVRQEVAYNQQLLEERNRREYERTQMMIRRELAKAATKERILKQRLEEKRRMQGAARLPKRIAPPQPVKVEAEVENLNRNLQRIRNEEERNRKMQRESVLANIVSPREAEELSRMQEVIRDNESQVEELKTQETALLKQRELLKKQEADATYKESYDQTQTQIMRKPLENARVSQTSPAEISDEALQSPIADGTKPIPQAKEAPSRTKTFVPVNKEAHGSKKRQLTSKLDLEQEPLDESLFLPQPLIDEVNNDSSKEWIKITEKEHSAWSTKRKWTVFFSILIFILIVGVAVVLALYFTDFLPNLPSPL